MITMFTSFLPISSPTNLPVLSHIHEFFLFSLLSDALLSPHAHMYKCLGVNTWINHYVKTDCSFSGEGNL